MSGLPELDCAAISLQNGWLSPQQFEEVKAALEADPGLSVPDLLRDRFGIAPSRFEGLHTIAEPATVDIPNGSEPDPDAHLTAVPRENEAWATLGAEFPMPSAQAESRTDRHAGTLASDSGNNGGLAEAATLGEAHPHDGTVDFIRTQSTERSANETIFDQSHEQGDGSPSPRHGATKETILADGQASAHVRMGQIGNGGLGISRERYTLTRLHARGGMGQVWLARDLALGREVALKELRPEQSPSRSANARFLEEAQITGQLEHPGIVPVYELKKSPDDDRPFYTMRFIRGGTLEQAIRDYHEKRRKGTATPLERAALLNAFVGACNAIDYAHSRGVIHRDLKGQNVVLGDYGEVMVLDWGLAKVVGVPDGAVAPEILLDENDPTHSPTLQGQVQGTPAYMAPEQAEGRIDEIDFRTDVYGLGAILYEILTGQAPFTGSTTQELLHSVSHAQPPSPRGIDPTVPKAIQEICAKAIAKKPEDRYQTARDMAMDIKRWLADEPVTAYREPWNVRASRWVKRHKAAVTSAAALLILATAGLAVTSVLIGKERDEARRQRQQARLAVDDMYSKVADQWLEDRLDPLQTEFLTKALAYYESFTQHDSRDPVVQQERGRAYLRMGDVLRKLGRHDEAGTAYGNAIAILSNLTQSDPKAIEPRFYLGNAQTRLAGSLAERGRYAEAGPLYQEAIKGETALVGDRPEAVYQTQLAKSHRGLAELLRITGKPTDSEKNYLAAEAILEPLAKDLSAVEPRQELALVDDGLGMLLREASRPSDAEKSYWKAADLLERLLADAPTLPQFRVGLAKVYNGIGLLMKDTGRENESESVLRKQVALNERLTDDFANRPNYKRALARSQINLAVLLAARGEPRAAEELDRKALAINETLSAEFKDVPDYRRDQARCLNNLGSLLVGRAQFGEAQSYYRQALALYEQLAKDAPEVPAHQFAIATAHLNIAQALRSLEKADEALISYQKATDLLVKLVREFPSNPDYLRAEAKCQENVGNVLASRKDHKGAEAAYARATSTLDDLISKKLAQPTDRLELSQLLSNRGENLKNGGLPEAEATLNRAVTIASTLVEEFPQGTNYQRQVAIASINLGEALVAANKLESGDAALQRAATVYAELIKKEPKNSDYLTELAVTQGDQADLRTRQKRMDEAIALQESAIQNQKGAAALNPRSTPTRLTLQRQLKSLAETLLAKQDHSGAAKATEEFVQVVPNTKGIRVDGARVLARCVTMVGSDTQVPADKRVVLAGVYADRAISLLRDAIQRGEIDAAKVQKDDVLTPLQSRESFKTLALVNPIKVAMRVIEQR